MSLKIKAPRGTFDILPDKSYRWQFVEREAHRFFQKFGYREIRTPIFEQRRLFERGVGESTEIVEKQMYIFQDRGGDWFALRPEGTAPVIRAFVEHALHQAEPPYRYYYIGPMFRHERPQKGRFRQFHQIGVEVLGEAEPATDAEVVAMAWSFLEHLGVPDLKLEINSIGCADCRPGYLKKLHAFLADHKDDLCADCRRRLEKNPLRILDCKNSSCQTVIDRAPDIADSWCSTCRTHFQEVLNLLTELHIPYNRQSRLVRGLDYYMRTTFEFVSRGLGAQNAVLGGGRYDGLVKDLGGPDWPGIGFAIGMERLLELIPDHPPDRVLDVVLIILNESARIPALQWASEARKQGFRVWFRSQISSLRSALRAVDRARSRYALILGPDELSTGQWTIRDMERGEQKSLSPESIVDYLRQNE